MSLSKHPKATSTDVSKRFGFWYDEAMIHPVNIERNGVVRVVMVPAAEYQRLARMDHVALDPTELTHDDIRAIRDAEFSLDEALEETTSG